MDPVYATSNAGGLVLAPFGDWRAARTEEEPPPLGEVTQRST